MGFESAAFSSRRVSDVQRYGGRSSSETVHLWELSAQMKRGGRMEGEREEEEEKFTFQVTLFNNSDK